jgi:hypothetical protein
VAPEEDFASVEPVFEAMLQTLQVSGAQTEE